MTIEATNRELTAEVLDLIAAGDINLGPFRFYYSQGARAFGVIVGGCEVYVGANSAGYNCGGQSGQVRY